MKRIFACLALVLGLGTVAVVQDVTTASATASCFYGVSLSPPLPSPQTAYTACDNLNHSIGEAQIAKVTCAVWVHDVLYFDTNGPYYGLWVHGDPHQHSTVVCGSVYPQAYYVSWIIEPGHY